MLNNFLPQSDGDMDTWEQNFITVFQSIGTNLGFTPAEVTAIVVDITGHRNAYATAVTKQAESKAAVEIAHGKRAVTVGNIRTTAKRINASPACTEAIRIMLKLKGTEHTVDLTALKPVLSDVRVGNNIAIKFAKPTPVDAIKLYCKRVGDTDFVWIGTNTHSPAADSRPRLDPAVPEVRQYRAIYLVKDVEVGRTSSVLEVLA